MNIALRSDLAKFVAEEIQAGRYASPEQVVEAALARLMLEPADDFAPGELDELIAEGEADIERGDVCDADEVFARLRRQSAEYRKAAQSAGKPTPKP